MKSIVVIDCRSTGKNFIEDIINRGYNPVVLHLKDADTEEGKRFGEHILEEYKLIPYEFDMIYEKDTFEETLEEVKKFDPILVLPGNERGVILATRLSHELGLLGNSIENLDAITLKHEMHNRLAQKGLRYIRGKVITSIEEALEFYDDEGLKEVVIKPIYSTGSASVRICLDRDEMIDALKILFDDVNYFGDKNDKLLVQERINGTEYIVNTVTHEGAHRVTLVWKYNKVKTSEGAIIYDSCETVNELGLGEAEMVEYAYNVADALGIRYGPVHGEYMIDDDGPVLIEVNCRPCGGSMSAEFLDKISGQHETDSILDSYLKPARFKEELKKKYELYAHGTLKFFIVPRDMIARSSPMTGISDKLTAFHDIEMLPVNNIDMYFHKTEDLETAAGFVFLAHEDKSEVEKNLNFLRAVEKNAFSLILSEDLLNVEMKDDDAYLTEIMPLIEKTKKYGTGLFVTDQFVEDIDMLQISYDRIDEVMGKFDFIIINLNKSLFNKTEAEKANMVLNVFSKVRTGGSILIPENTYNVFVSGRRGIEALIKVLDYKIELPPYTIQDVVIASRET